MGLSISEQLLKTILAQVIVEANQCASLLAQTRAAASIAVELFAEPALFTGPVAGVNPGTAAAGIVRVNPTSTQVSLPDVTQQSGLPLRVFDWSTISADHTITILPFGTQTIMQQPSLVLVSTASWLARASLFPSIDLNGWYIGA